MFVLGGKKKKIVIQLQRCPATVANILSYQDLLDRP